MTTPLDQTRAEFEAWARELPDHTPNYHKRFPKEAGAAGGKYFDPVTELAWEAWQAAIASMAAGWISVNEQLPGDGQEVIALFWPYNNQENRRCVMGAFYEADRDVFLTDTDGDDMHRPSHWMVRPPTPQDPPIAAKAAKETT